MGKPLSEMSIEELWGLFPIVLEPHKEYWKDWYHEEAHRILNFVTISQVKLHHIGSTAIKEIWAKPIVDILLEVPLNISLDDVKKELIQNDYICMSETEKRKSFNRGYTNEGFAEKVFHLHVRYQGDDDEVYFRDYMNNHPQAAKEYEALKLSLWKKYEHNRDAYTDAKGQLVLNYTELAKMESII